MQEELDLAVIIPVYNDPLVKECVESIDENIEIVLVLNGVTKEVREIVAGLEERYSKLRVIDIGEPNLGKAYDIGIKSAYASNVLMNDSDCLFEKGCIRKMYNGLKDYDIVKGVVKFGETGYISKIIRRSREYHCSDLENAYFPPIAFKKDIKEQIGYYFSHDIFWCEDVDFDQRIQKAKIKILFQKDSIILHKALNLKSDLRSAFRYGTGYRIGIKLDLIEPIPLYGGNKGIGKSILYDFYRITKIFKFIYDVAAKKEKGMMTAFYMCIWMFAFTSGYYMQIIFKYHELEREYEKNTSYCDRK